MSYYKYPLCLVLPMMTNCFIDNSNTSVFALLRLGDLCSPRCPSHDKCLSLCLAEPMMTSKSSPAAECECDHCAPCLLCPVVAGRPPTWSEYACSPTDVVERSEAVTWRETTIMGRLEETGVWADERWAPQLQRVTKQPPSLLVSRRE